MASTKRKIQSEQDYLAYKDTPEEIRYFRALTKTLEKNEIRLSDYDVSELFSKLDVESDAFFSDAMMIDEDALNEFDEESPLN